MKFANYLKRKFSWILLFVVLIVAGISHAYNMFHFPYFENDEGTYMSQAWSLLNYGKLAPYTYWYDHAPGGWIFLFLWVKVTGGFFAFGHSVNSGRVFMLVLHIAVAALLFYIAKKLSKSNLAGIIAVLFFSLSPLGIYFQRRLLLDNIMIFWVILSLALLLVDKLKLRHIIFSAICFGISVLSKENAVFFLPAFLYVLYVRSHTRHRTIAIVKWILISGFVVLFYILYALLKGELFQSDVNGGSVEHVSLLGTLHQQLSRGTSSFFWDKSSDFYISFIKWIQRDSYIIYGGLIATFAGLLLSIKEKSFRIPTLFTLMFLLFLVRGKLVIDFYVVPLIPLFSLNIGLVSAYIIRKFSFNKNLIYVPFSMLLIGCVIALFMFNQVGQYTLDETTPQLKAMNWILKNVPKDKVIAIDDFAEVEFRENGFKNAIWFWKIWEDPAEQKKFQNNWEDISYILMTHEMLKQLGQQKLDINYLQDAYSNSNRVVMYGPTSKVTFIDFQKKISTNGDWAAVYKLKEKNNIILENSWSFYKSNFIKSYGQTMDLSKSITTSEGQSYTMLRAFVVGDKATFDGAWSWTKDHMQYRTNDKLFSWLWGVKGGEEQVLDTGHATDADEDIALALILAGNKWGSAVYTKDAKIILNDLWETSVVEVKGKYVMHAGTGFDHNDGYVINPSYFSPASYRVFAQIDKSHDWEQLADDSYYFLDQVSSMKGNSSALPLDWVFISKSGAVSSAKKYMKDKEDQYGYDAFRTIWRIALDYQWFKSADAKSYLEKTNPFFEKEWNNQKNVFSVYKLDGEASVDYKSLATSVGLLSNMMVTNPNLGKSIYKELYINTYQKEGYWGNSNDYYDQNWAWFGSALYSNSLLLPSSLVNIK